MVIEPKDIFTTVVAGSTAISGLLFVLIGFLLSAKETLKKLTPADARKYNTPIWVIVIILVFNSLITIFGIAWPLGLHNFISINLFAFILLISFLIATVALIPISIWIVSSLL